MNKTNIQQWLTVLLVGVYFPASSQNFSIQLCAFTESIQPAFFKYAGFGNVLHQADELNVNHYYWGAFETLDDAQTQFKEISTQAAYNELGNMQIVQLSATPLVVPIGHISTSSNIPKSVGNQLFTRSILFQDNLYTFKKSTLKTLDEVANILIANPTLKLRIIGQSVQKTEQNAPIKTSSTTIKNYLLAKDIPAYRLKILTPTPQDATALNTLEVVLTLVDLKEEIVLDNFSSNTYLVKKEGENGAVNMLE